MKYSELKSYVPAFRPAILVSRLISFRALRIARFLSLVVATVSVVLIVFGKVISFMPSGFAGILHRPLQVLAPYFFESLLLSIFVFLIIFMTTSFFNSYYFLGLDNGLRRVKRFGTYPKISYEVALLVSGSPDDDLILGFLESPYGRLAMKRAGILTDEFRDFLSKRRHKIDPASLEISSEQTLGFATYAFGLYEKDEEFSKFLFSKKIQMEDFRNILNWIDRNITEAKKSARWWSRESLGKIPGIGRNWAYGSTYILDRYSRDFSTTAFFRDAGLGRDDRRPEILELEAVLAKDREANVILVGEHGAGAMEIIGHLANKIEEGNTQPSLENKRVVLFDSTLFVSTAGNKTAFERELARVLNEAVRAGNVIVVFADLAGFISSAKTLGADAMAIMADYIATPNIQIIAVADPSHFHESIESNSAIMELFETIIMKDTRDNAVIRVLEDACIREEYRYGIFFTYPALRAISDSAERYFPSGVMPDKAIDLLSEIAPAVKSTGGTIVTADDVLHMVESKTGIPAGAVGKEEKARLLNLEKVLHERIVGQDEAVVMIANAMRRARSGVGNRNRPMGSFLFLGPTGVGKTETAKVLADTFFSNQHTIQRLDMSEYSTDDSLQRLIGSADTNHPGTLSSMIRENPYGVLLLDEFEKTSRAVLDLFLQVLDEGIFSDMHGKAINVRNMIIIATSNAGSDLIWKIMREGGNLEAEKVGVLDALIKNNVFKPELLNRFDGVVLFRPFNASELQKVASLILLRLKQRLSEKGIGLEINTALVQMLMNEGVDPKYGARAMNRAVQDKIEQIIARRVISGALKAGSTLTLTEKDFANGV